MFVYIAVVSQKKFTTKESVYGDDSSGIARKRDIEKGVVAEVKFSEADILKKSGGKGWRFVGKNQEEKITLSEVY